MSIFFKLYNFLNSNQKKYIIYFVLLLLLATALEVISISLIFPALAFIIESNDQYRFGFLLNIFPFLKNLSSIELLLGFLLIFSLINLIKAFYLIFFSWWRNNFIYNLDRNINYNLYKLYLSSSLASFNVSSSAEFTKNIINESKKVRVSIDSSLKLITEILMVVSILSVLVFFQPIPSLITISVFGIVGIIINKILKNKLYRYGLQNVVEMTKVFQNLKDGFGSFKDIKIRNNEKFFLNRFFSFVSGAFTAIKYQSIISESVKIIIELIAILFFCFLIYFLINSNVETKDLIPTLALFAAAAYRFLPGINKIITYTQSLQNNSAAINTLYKDLIKEKNNPKVNQKDKISFKKEIKFENVSFKFSGSSNYIIKNLNFRISKNDFLCIFGPSGEGKTTFIDLLSGLLKPNTGKISVDDEDINLEKKSWTKNVGYVQQKVYLLNDTIKKNIIFDEDNEIDSKKLKYAIESAQLDTFINSKKEGINFEVGDNGSKLSGGQIQRVGIARSLYVLPDILICDEFSSSLDKETESKLIESLMKLRGKLTIIFITHRPDVFRESFIKKYELSTNENSDTELKKIN